VPAVGRAAFEAAVDAYDLETAGVDTAPARDALEASGGLLVLGESHGVEQTPAVVYVLLRELGIRRLALEWAEEELRAVAEGDLDALWALPPEAEAFSGDGRLTAGHLALLRSARLDEVVLLDRVGSEGESRSLAMLERLLAAPRPLLAVVGAGHVTRELPGVRPVLLAWDGGRVWFHGENDLSTDLPELPIELPLPPARAATVPLHGRWGPPSTAANG
jgi:hypothetical protein